MNDDRLRKTTLVTKLPLVLVEWDDAAADPGWKLFHDARNKDIARCLTAGWLIKKTAKVVQVAHSIGDSGDVMDVISIPAGTVIRIRRLKR